MTSPHQRMHSPSTPGSDAGASDPVRRPFATRSQETSGDFEHLDLGRLHSPRRRRMTAECIGIGHSSTDCPRAPGALLDGQITLARSADQPQRTDVYSVWGWTPFTLRPARAVCDSGDLPAPKCTISARRAPAPAHPVAANIDRFTMTRPAIGQTVSPREPSPGGERDLSNTTARGTHSSNHG
jgi:hypothetical protein